MTTPRPETRTLILSADLSADEFASIGVWMRNEVAIAVAAERERIRLAVEALCRVNPLVDLGEVSMATSPGGQYVKHSKVLAIINGAS